MVAFIIVLSIIAVILLVLSICGLKWSKDFQYKGGYYFIGGISGAPAKKYFSTHPKSKMIFDKLDSRGGNWTDQAFLDDLFASGVKGLVTAKLCSDVIVVTDEIILVYGTPNDRAYGTKGQFFTQDGWKTFRTSLHLHDVKEIIGQSRTITPAKQKNVVGSAVAGAVVAGGAGAVVGAVAAANHNNNAKDKVETQNIYGRTVSKYCTFTYESDRKFFELDTLYEANGRIDPNPTPVNFQILFHH
jgi:hypothetical protein